MTTISTISPDCWVIPIVMESVAVVDDDPSPGVWTTGAFPCLVINEFRNRICISNSKVAKTKGVAECGKCTNTHYFFFRPVRYPPPPPPTYQIGYVFHEHMFFWMFSVEAIFILVIWSTPHTLTILVGNFTPNHSTSLSFWVYNSGRFNFFWCI